MKQKVYLKTKDEKEILHALNILGYTYLARNKNGKLHAYQEEPSRGVGGNNYRGTWGAGGDSVYLGKDTFTHIKTYHDPIDIKHIIKQKEDKS